MELKSTLYCIRSYYYYSYLKCRHMTRINLDYHTCYGMTTSTLYNDLISYFTNKQYYGKESNLIYTNDSFVILYSFLFYFHTIKCILLYLLLLLFIFGYQVIHTMSIIYIYTQSLIKQKGKLPRIKWKSQIFCK